MTVDSRNGCKALGGGRQSQEAEEGDRFFFGSAIAGEHDQICSYGLGKSTVRVIRGGIRGGTP